MDMITKIEIEDAVKNHKKVQDRVAEVAFQVARANREFDQVESPRWKVERFTFSDASNRSGIEPQCHVTFRVPWYDRPETERYGNPEEDDEGPGHYVRSSDYLHCFIAFPTRYLFTEDWVPEMEKQAAERAERLRQMNIEVLAETISKKADELAALRHKLTRLVGT